MKDYDDLFNATAPDDSVFADKSALDSLTEPEEVVDRARLSILLVQEIVYELHTMLLYHELLDRQ